MDDKPLQFPIKKNDRCAKRKCENKAASFPIFLFYSKEGGEAVRSQFNLPVCSGCRKELKTADLLTSEIFMTCNNAAVRKGKTNFIPGLTRIEFVAIGGDKDMRENK